MELLKAPLYSNEMDANNDISFFCDKFCITKDDFNNIMNSPLKTINDYPNTPSTLLYKAFEKFKQIVKIIIRYKSLV
jgi:hypothetical protein